MKIIISESKLSKIIDLYLDKAIGKMKKKYYSTTDTTQWFDQYQNKIFFLDKAFGTYDEFLISFNIFHNIKSMFSLSDEESKRAIINWFNKKNPNNKIKDTFKINIYRF